MQKQDEQSQQGAGMTKADLVEILHDRLEITSREAFEQIETLLGLIKNTLEADENLKISGFGNFVVKEKSL